MFSFCSLIFYTANLKLWWAPLLCNFNFVYYRLKKMKNKREQDFLAPSCIPPPCTLLRPATTASPIALTPLHIIPSWVISAISGGRGGDHRTPPPFGVSGRERGEWSRRLGTGLGLGCQVQRLMGLNVSQVGNSGRVTKSLTNQSKRRTQIA